MTKNSKRLFSEREQFLTVIYVTTHMKKKIQSYERLNIVELRKRTETEETNCNGRKLACDILGKSWMALKKMNLHCESATNRQSRFFSSASSFLPGCRFSFRQALARFSYSLVRHRSCCSCYSHCSGLCSSREWSWVSPTSLQMPLRNKQTELRARSISSCNDR